MAGDLDGMFKDFDGIEGIEQFGFAKNQARKGITAFMKQSAGIHLKTPMKKRSNLYWISSRLTALPA